MAAADVFSADRLPPQSKDAEKGVIGGVLRDNQVLNDIQTIIRTENFYFDAHQKIYQAVVDTYSEGKPVDLVILFEILKARKQLEDVGGAAYLMELWESAPTAANTEYYARIVRDKAVVRNLIHVNTELLRDAYDGVMSADELLGSAERKVLEIAEKGTTGEVASLEKTLQVALTRIDERMGREHRDVSGIPTGFVDLDNITAGLQNNELVIIAARPSVGKTAFALNLVRHVIVEEKLPVFFVSLEQSRIEIAERLLCCQAKVDGQKLRKGHLSSEDMDKILRANDALTGNARDGKVKLFIDDTPSQGMLRIAANARRLKLRHGIRLIVIDYLQLIDPESRRDPRQEQVAQISRRLKFLARELQLPVIALAQVNRGSEDRQDHKPRLSDLRESGCLTGDTLIPLADTGERVPIRALAGRSGFPVWALNETTFRIEPATVSSAFSTGRKPVFRLTTRLGRTIRATANHPFRAFGGWKRLDELATGERIAMPRRTACPTQPGTMSGDALGLLGQLIGDGCTLPRHAIQYTTNELDLAEVVRDAATAAFGTRVAPRIQRERQWYQVYLSATANLTHGVRNPVAEWLDDLGVFGLRSHEKRVPAEVFRQPAEAVARFLRHLWATDGCIKAPAGATRHPAIYYATSSERLARDVQELLARFEINAVVSRRGQGGKGRDQHPVMVMGHDDILRFADRISALGARKSAALLECRNWLDGRPANTNRDVIPRSVWETHVKPAMVRNGVPMRAMQAALGMRFCGTALYKTNVSRTRLGRVAEAVGGDDALTALATSDVYWDEVVSVIPDGDEEVFDLTVPGPHNFVADGFVVHNSIEQDADTCMILHRPGKFDGGQEDNILEIIIAKQRNGPTGEISLHYMKQFMRYENRALDGPL